ncbi:hypothetical protein HB662_14915 [Roseomonas frigidaquae]|uniref:DUF222 domain-containing protein n=1 Tax=Falsiroseomonas frigidaquae TaxID=487318 RepID=A0ABX1F147_9PROT|nr:hypothetical protein [Falsiroseomonas frigidaquae]NKE46076.1 hypothetical protein [Falsiroseomonas frigidaquae]
MTEPATTDGPAPQDSRAGAEQILAKLAGAIGEVVDLIGRDAVQLAFATVARRGGEGPLDAGALAAGGEEQGEVARRAVSMAVDLLAPAIGAKAAASLAHNVRRLGDGSTLPKLLTVGAATHRRLDPASRSHVVMAVSAMAQTLHARARAQDDDARGTAMDRLSRIGLRNEKPPQGYVEIELAILKVCNVHLDQKRWGRAKAALTPDHRASVEIVVKALVGTLDEADRQRIGQEDRLLDSMKLLLPLAHPAALDTPRIEQTKRAIRFFWRR